MSSLAESRGKEIEEQASNVIDRISDLPKPILHHILSLLPTTRDAVATCLVSKSWQCHWTNVNNLIFDNDGRFRYRPIKFADFVDRVLLSLNQQTIDKFSLTIDKCSEFYDLSSWVTTAVARKVKCFDFSLRYNYYPGLKFPSCVFTCKTLVDLCLSGVEIPSSTCLPNLKTLRLEFVTYQFDQSFINLLRGCPLLETLYIDRDAADDLVDIKISSPTLINLTLKCDEEDRVYCKLEINAPALRYLYLSDCLSMDFSIKNLSSLNEAEIKVRETVDEADVDNFSKAVVELLQGIRYVKHLSLSGGTLKALGHYTGACPSFPRLTRLNVRRGCFRWNSLLRLMDGSNKLLDLTFSERWDPYGEMRMTRWIKPEKVPICVLSSLKTMSLMGFKSLEDDDLAMVAYVLKNAKVLTTMTIAVRDIEVEKKFQLLRKVSEFPRGSEICQLKFS